MKKLVLTVTLVALLVAAVFGGQVIASSKPADVTVSEETSSILGSSYWGYPIRMKTLSGHVEIDSKVYQKIFEETYSGVRHISLTVFMLGSDSGSQPEADGVWVTTYIPAYPGDIGMERHYDANTYRTYEFDTDNWKLIASDWGGEPLHLYYWATITYPSNQW